MRGTLAFPGFGTYAFLRCLCPHGWPLDQATMQEDELRDPGVDAMRWRDESLQHEPFTMSTTIDSDTYDEAIGFARAYLRCRSKIGQLTVTIRGTTHTWKRVHVIKVKPTIIPGRVMSAEAAPSATCGVMAEWDLIFVDIEPIASA